VSLIPFKTIDLFDIIHKGLNAHTIKIAGYQYPYYVFFRIVHLRDVKLIQLGRGYYNA
jgi:hypothetical protein